MDYTYVGYTDGMKLVKGRVTADDEQAAVDMLGNIGCEVVNLKLVGGRVGGLRMKVFEGRVKPAELSTFARQLALLIESGVGILQSLELLQGQTTDSQLRRVLLEVVSDVRNGSPLSSAMAKHPKVFSTIFHRLVGVGEQTGSLETVLTSLAVYAEKQAATRNKIKQAMTYPSIVIGLAIAVLIFMVTTVLPPIVDMFTSLGGDLPITTKLMLGFVAFLNQYGLYALIALVVLGFIIFLYSRTSAGRYRLDELILKLPLFGRINLASELARNCRSIALLYKAGLPLPDIMALVGQSSGNRVIAKAMSDVEFDMIRGAGLSAPMRKSAVFLPLMVEMTRVGEETGSLDTTLMTVAENYEIEADRRIQAFVSMIEPAMTIAVGLVVGFMALSIFMPLYSSLSLVK